MTASRGQSLSGLRRTLRRARLSDAADIDPALGAALPAVFALELAVDLARIEALIAVGDAALVAARRASLLTQVKAVISEDLAEGSTHRVHAAYLALSNAEGRLREIERRRSST
jgi:hypothetical protein